MRSQGYGFPAVLCMAFLVGILLDLLLDLLLDPDLDLLLDFILDMLLDLLDVLVGFPHGPPPRVETSPAASAGVL